MHLQYLYRHPDNQCSTCTNFYCEDRNKSSPIGTLKIHDNCTGRCLFKRTDILSNYAQKPLSPYSKQNEEYKSRVYEINHLEYVSKSSLFQKSPKQANTNEVSPFIESKVSVFKEENDRFNQLKNFEELLQKLSGQINLKTEELSVLAKCENLISAIKKQNCQQDEIQVSVHRVSQPYLNGLFNDQLKTFDQIKPKLEKTRFQI